MQSIDNVILHSRDLRVSIRTPRATFNFNCVFLINQLRVFPSLHLTRVVSREVADIFEHFAAINCNAVDME